ncbi:PTS sugar transporter subunit IIA [Nitrosomonas communis]|uniref:PTS system, ascorbate-specific IIA component n=1 Tax=Nitrosomonas communis TaxID=44574 RepID=A0A1I4QZ93_9PROT|nr:PTS fructose transporter subunit IIA [Nitrosomonas communis]SFM45392.1 PTS system, ascorbate-specific IIA component [Nitrosomonas communis]
MIGILIISHDKLGESFTHCATHILGEKPQQLIYQAISIQDKPDEVVAQAKELIKKLDQGDGVLVMTDILGATPSNIATQLIQAGKVECLAGMNLPMLVRALNYRHEPLSIVVAKALAGGKEGVMHILRGC